MCVSPAVPCFAAFGPPEPRAASPRRHLCAALPLVPHCSFARARRPRKANLQGYGQRGYHCHLNSIENFGFITAATLSAIVLGGDPAAVRGMSIAYVVSRLLYTIVFIWGEHPRWGPIRSIIFVLGLFVGPLGLFIVAMAAPRR